MQKTILIISIFILAFLNLTAKELTVGWESWAPYQIKENGKLTGLDIDLVRAIAENAGYELKFISVPWKRHLVMLEEGKIDIATGASKTLEREEYANFSDPYRKEKAVMFVRKGEAKKYGFNNLKEIMNREFELGVTRGYYYGEMYKKIKENPEFSKHLQVVQNDEVNYKKLVNSRIDGFLADLFAGSNGLKNAGLFKKVEVHPMKVYDDDIFLMFSKKSVPQKVLDDFNRSLGELKNNGELEKIFNKYLK